MTIATYNATLISREINEFSLALLIVILGFNHDRALEPTEIGNMMGLEGSSDDATKKDLVSPSNWTFQPDVFMNVPGRAISNGIWINAG